MFLVFTISCCVLLTYPPRVTSIDTDTDKVMEWVSSKFDKKIAVAKEGEGCDASHKLFTSLSYLRSISVNETGAVKPREEIETQIKAHPEFYNEKLKTLDKSKLSDVTCEDRRLCVEKVCKFIWDIDQLTETEDEEGYEEVFFPENIEDWEAENLDFETPWKDLKASLRTWITTYEKITANLSPEGSYCNASKEQNNALKDLEFYLRQKSVGILNHAWPRLFYYGKGLEDVTNAVDKSTVFCILSGKPSSVDRVVCVNGECTNCFDITETKTSIDYSSKNSRPGGWEHWSYCESKHVTPIPNKHRVKELEEYNSKLFKEPEGPPGVLTLEEALEWNATFPNTAVLKLNDDCDANDELSLAQKFFIAGLMKTSVEGNVSLWRWRTKEELKGVLENTTSGKAWLLKGLDKTRKMCGDLLVCGPDGLCIQCENKTALLTNLEITCFYATWRQEDSMVMIQRFQQTTTVKSDGDVTRLNWMNPALLTIMLFISKQSV